MASDQSDDGDKGLSETDKKARTILAKVLWQADNKDQNFADNAARNAAYKEARKVYFGKARQVTKQLEKRGVTLNLSADATTDA